MYRSSITVKSDTKDRGIYIYSWTLGDKGSIAAIIEEAKFRLENQSFSKNLKTNAINAQRLLTTIYAVISELVSQDPNSLLNFVGTEVFLLEDRKLGSMKLDFGCYQIDDNFNCDRLNCQLNFTELQNYLKIKQFFKLNHYAKISVIPFGILHNDPNPTADAISYDIEQLLAVKQLTENQIKQLERKLADITPQSTITQ